MVLLIIYGGKITEWRAFKFQNDFQEISDNFGYVYSLAQANWIICDFETSLFSNNILNVFQYSVEIPPTTRKSPLLRE